MKPLTERELRNSLVNASTREKRIAILPDLATVDWDRIDVLGWRDARQPRVGYVVLELDGRPTGVLLRTTASTRRKMLCTWCHDIVSRDQVVLYVARRTGPAGRRGNTVGTAICADFGCSANVRRPPSLLEMSREDPEEAQLWIDLRIEQLRERCLSFVENVMRDDA